MPNFNKTIQVSDTMHSRLKKRADALRQKLKFVTEDVLVAGLSKQKPAKGDQK